MTMNGPVVVVVGVAGAGKTTVGSRLAQVLGCPFLDADDFQTPEGVDKLAGGRRLSETERGSWLRRVGQALAHLARAGDAVVLAFPGLRQTDRDAITEHVSQTRFVYLKAPLELLTERVAARGHPFFNPSLLPSEFGLLEEPADALALDARDPPDHLVQQIVEALRQPPGTA